MEVRGYEFELYNFIEVRGHEFELHNMCVELVKGWGKIVSHFATQDKREKKKDFLD